MKKHNIFNIIFLCFIASIITFFSISYVFIPEKVFSEEENRILQTSPIFTFEKLLDGTYTHQLHNYFSDQINLRTQMIEIKACTELLMGKKENNGLLLGLNNYIIDTHPYTEENYTLLSKNLNKIEKMMQSLSINGVKVNSVIIPRKIDILQDYLPKYYSNERNKDVWNLVDTSHYTLTDTLSEAQNNGSQVFYKTDHHWTNDGVYAAYKKICGLLGIVPYSLDTFNAEILSNEFFGTSYSKSGFFFLSTETIYAPSIEIGKYEVTIVDTDTVFDTLYDSSYLNKKDKYSVFLSGNNAHVKIYDTKNQNKETLLMIKDSFSHSLAPYLCEHFNIELIDPRYFSGSIYNYIEENDIKNVLFLFGIDTLAISNLLIK